MIKRVYLRDRTGLCPMFYTNYTPGGIRNCKLPIDHDGVHRSNDDYSGRTKGHTWTDEQHHRYCSERLSEAIIRKTIEIVPSERLNLDPVEYYRPGKHITAIPGEASIRVRYEEEQRVGGKTVRQFNCFSVDTKRRKRTDTYIVEDNCLIEWKNEPTWENATMAHGQLEGYEWRLNNDEDLFIRSLSPDKVVGFSSCPSSEILDFLHSKGYSVLFNEDGKFRYA